VAQAAQPRVDSPGNLRNERTTSDRTRQASLNLAREAYLASRMHR